MLSFIGRRFSQRATHLCYKIHLWRHTRTIAVNAKSALIACTDRTYLYGNIMRYWSLLFWNNDQKYYQKSVFFLNIWTAVITKQKSYNEEKHSLVKEMTIVAMGKFFVAPKISSSCMRKLLQNRLQVPLPRHKSWVNLIQFSAIIRFMNCSSFKKFRI